jgi:hypothetical protein
MTDKFKAGIEAWQTAMDQKQFKVALKAAINAFLQAEVDGDDLESRAALGRVHLATSELIFGQLSNSRPVQSCSFCGQSGSDVRLGAGPDVFICADCVGIFYEEVGLRPDKLKPT